MRRGNKENARPLNGPAGGTNSQPGNGVKNLPVLGPLKKVPARGRLQSFVADLERLRVVSAAATAQQQPVNRADFLMVQMEVLQEAFLSLAGAVVTELDDLRKEASQWQSDRETWLSAIRTLRQEANDKLLSVEKAQASAEVELAAARSEMQAHVLRQSERLEAQAAELRTQVTAARVEVKLLEGSVREMQTLTSEDFPNEVLRARMLDKAAMDEAINQAVRDVLPRRVAEAVREEAPGAVRDQVGALLQETVRSATEPFKHEVIHAVERLSSDVESVSTDLAALAGSVEALGTRARALESSVSSTDGRLLALEAGGAAGAGPESLLVGLQDRVETIAKQHAQYARSMEEVVRAVVGEAEGLVQAIARQDEVLRTHQSHLADTRHALLRCATTFSQALGIPPPVSTTALAASIPSQPGALPPDITPGLDNRAAGQRRSATGAGAVGTGYGLPGRVGTAEDQAVQRVMASLAAEGVSLDSPPSSSHG